MCPVSNYEFHMGVVRKLCRKCLKIISYKLNLLQDKSIFSNLCSKMVEDSEDEDAFVECQIFSDELNISNCNKLQVFIYKINYCE